MNPGNQTRTIHSTSGITPPPIPGISGIMPPPIPGISGIPVKQTTKKVRSIIKQEDPAVLRGRNKRFLKTLCPNASLCASLHLYPDQLNGYFDHFSFRYLTNHIRRIGEPSKNGFVYELVYENNKYKAASIIKTSRKKRGHPLLYEAYIGEKYMNKLASSFLCFLQTYQCYIHADRNIYNIMSDGQNITKHQLIRALDVLPVYSKENIVTYSCLHPDKVAIQIEHVHGAMDLHAFLSIGTEAEIAMILYQVYKPLSVLKDVFTHYDLHTHNVMVYQIPDGQWVELVYEENGVHVMKFRTRYIAKIIDYGRSYTPVSAEYKNALPDECKQNGMWFFDELMPKRHYTSCTIANESHDLRAAHILSKYAKTNSVFHILLRRVKYDATFGTEPIHEYMSNPAADPIRNVSDMAVALDYLFSRDSSYVNGGPGFKSAICTLTTELNHTLEKPVQVLFHEVSKSKQKTVFGARPSLSTNTRPSTTINVEKVVRALHEAVLEEGDENTDRAEILTLIHESIGWLFDMSLLMDATIDQLVLSVYIFLSMVQTYLMSTDYIMTDLATSLILAGVYSPEDETNVFDVYADQLGDVSAKDLTINYNRFAPIYKPTYFKMSKIHKQISQVKEPMTEEDKPHILSIFQMNARFFQPDDTSASAIAATQSVSTA